MEKVYKTTGERALYAIQLPFVWAYARLEDFDRLVLKRYFGIETPVYKWWWRRHKAWMQKRIYNVHPEFDPNFPSF